MTKEQELIRDIRRIKRARKGKSLRKSDKHKISIKEKGLRVLMDNNRFHRARYDALESMRKEAHDVWNGIKPATKDLDLYSYDVEEADWHLLMPWRPVKELPFELSIISIGSPPQ